MKKISKIGPFIIDNLLLGSGSFAKVFSSHHEESNVKVAMKVFDKTLVYGNQKQRIKVERELAILRVLHHRYIIDYYASFETSKLLFVVEELLSGGELFSLVESKGRLEIDEAVYYFNMINSALMYLHKYDICHRDVKLENVLLTKDHRYAKLCDFGFATYCGGTKIKYRCGSPYYASPEIFDTNGYNGCIADIWSAGVSFYIMIFGEFPYDYNEDDNIDAYIHLIRTTDWDFAFDVPEGIKEVLRGMLCKDVNNRIKLRKVKELLKPFSTFVFKSKDNEDNDYFDNNDYLYDSNDEEDYSIKDSVDDISDFQHQYQSTSGGENTSNYQINNYFNLSQYNNYMYDISSLSNHSIHEIDSKIMQTLTYLLDPIPVEMIQKGLHSSSPNAIKAFYKSIEMHSTHPISSIERYELQKSLESNQTDTICDDNNSNNNNIENNDNNRSKSMTMYNYNKSNEHHSTSLSIDEFKLTPRMRMCLTPTSTSSSLRETLSPAFNTLLKRHQKISNTSPINIPFSKTYSPPSSLTLPHEMDVLMNPIKTEYSQELLLNLNCDKAIEIVSSICKDCGIIIDNPITKETFGKCIIDENNDKNAFLIQIYQDEYSLLISDDEFFEKCIVKAQFIDGKNPEQFVNKWKCIEEKLQCYISHV